MLLLDTCTLIWIAQDRTQLSSRVSLMLDLGGPGPAIVSAASAFEVAIKVRKGKLTLPVPVEQWFPHTIERYQLRVEPIFWEDALKSALLPPHHNDPMDRIIIATAQRLKLPIATPDPLIQEYTEVTTVW
jgi:PIN domain nuclease of toxin-antitoxin system